MAADAGAEQQQVNLVGVGADGYGRAGFRTREDELGGLLARGVDTERNGRRHAAAVCVGGEQPGCDGSDPNGTAEADCVVTAEGDSGIARGECSRNQEVDLDRRYVEQRCGVRGFVSSLKTPFFGSFAVFYSSISVARLAMMIPFFQVLLTAVPFRLWHSGAESRHDYRRCPPPPPARPPEDPEFPPERPPE